MRLGTCLEGPEFVNIRYFFVDIVCVRKKKNESECGKIVFFAISPFFLKHCGIGHLKKTRQLPDLKLYMYNVPQHSLFKLCNFMKK